MDSPLLVVGPTVRHRLWQTEEWGKFEVSITQCSVCSAGGY